MHKLIIISGPSCVGKTPLFKAFKEFYPAVSSGMKKLVLYNSRAPRPGEKEGVDYFFRRRKEVAALKREPGFVMMNVRGDLQALDIVSLRKTLSSSAVIFEGNPFIGGKLLSLKQLNGVPKRSVFISPLSKEEITAIRKKSGRTGLERFIGRMMRRKLVVRAIKQGRKLDPYTLRDIARRAKSAYLEMKEAWRYDFVIPNHDGEDSRNWDQAPVPIGEARKSLTAFACSLKGKRPSFAEKWPKGLF